MPTYDYVCRFCDHAFEHFQGINDPLLRKCPECGRHGLKRLFGVGAGVVFKGSGFYETDYKRKGGSGGKPTSDKAGDTSGDKSSSTSGKAADKPAAEDADGKPSSGDKGKGPGDKGGKPSGDKPA
jgi:putative FmdB family regulatory protein